MEGSIASTIVKELKLVNKGLNIDKELEVSINNK